MKIIIGLVGEMACGKETVKNYLGKKYSAKNARFSSILRDILKRIDLPINRDNLINLSTSLRQTFGQDILAMAIAGDARNLDTDIVVIDGVRRMEDIKFLKEINGFMLISMDAPIETRYKRMVSRNENIGDDKKTFEDFASDHKRETELEIPLVMKNAKFSINNEGTFEELYLQVDKIIADILKN